MGLQVAQLSDQPGQVQRNRWQRETPGATQQIPTQGNNATSGIQNECMRTCCYFNAGGISAITNCLRTRSWITTTHSPESDLKMLCADHAIAPQMYQPIWLDLLYRAYKVLKSMPVVIYTW